MKTSALIALTGATMVASHALPIAVWVNGADQGVGNEAGGYIRKAPSNSPITDVTSKDMTCNVGGTTKAAKSVAVKAGDKLDIEWYHNTRGDDIIDGSHKGPIMTYLAPASSNGAGNVWVKINEEGIDAVTKLISNKGKHSLTIPSSLAAGDYILRDEILALHEGNREGGAQFYPNCIQITVSSSGSTSLPAGVAIPGAYKATDPGVLFDIYSGTASAYTIPGPKVWDGARGGDSTPTPPTNGTPSPAPSTPATTPVTPAPSTPAEPAPSQAPGNGNGGALPDSFTLDTFITWLRANAGTSTKKAKKVSRAHARAFQL